METLHVSLTTGSAPVPRDEVLREIFRWLKGIVAWGQPYRPMRYCIDLPLLRCETMWTTVVSVSLDGGVGSIREAV